ncbi:hypothetical protein BD769DRAFT_1700668 [Suillus cothurnatus]|nr:hypothetical protein BD769DRAFT_1700668 [Suillus cothurnatus]
MLLSVNRTMPRALLISEIFSNIISHLNVDECDAHQWQADYVAPSGPTLFALALTCRAFSEQALDALWNTLRGVEPFMRCAGIISEEGERLQDFPIIPTEAQMAIISRYANRVRSANILLEGSDAKPTRLACQISLYPPAPPLTWPTSAPSLHLCIYLQVSARPAVLAENFVAHDLTGSSSLPDPWDGPLALPVSYAIQNLQKLRTVNVPAITKDALTYLGGLSSFTSIKTRLPTGSDLEDFLNSSRSPILFENFNSVDWEIEEWRDVEAFFDSLHVREAFRNLQCIRLTDFANYDVPIGTVITIDTIRPLFYLSHLRVVEINTASCRSIGEDELEEIGQAWPCLEVLLFNESNGFMPNAPLIPLRVSLSDVVRFVERYPRVRQLSIGITISSVNDDYDMEEASLRALEPRDSNSRLNFLVLKYPPNEENMQRTYQSRFDILLKKLFPRLGPDSPDSPLLQPDENF